MCISSSLSVITISLSPRCCTHFTDEEISSKAALYPKGHTQEAAELGFEPRTLRAMLSTVTKLGGWPHSAAYARVCSCDCRGPGIHPTSWSLTCHFASLPACSIPWGLQVCPSDLVTASQSTNGKVALKMNLFRWESCKT